MIQIKYSVTSRCVKKHIYNNIYGLKMKPVFILIEIKSDGEYFMTSIKGQNFQHNGLALRTCPLSAGSTVLL